MCSAIAEKMVCASVTWPLIFFYQRCMLIPESIVFFILFGFVTLTLTICKHMYYIIVNESLAKESRIAGWVHSYIYVHWRQWS